MNNRTHCPHGMNSARLDSLKWEPIIREELLDDVVTSYGLSCNGERCVFGDLNDSIILNYYSNYCRRNRLTKGIVYKKEDGQIFYAHVKYVQHTNVFAGSVPEDGGKYIAG